MRRSEYDKHILEEDIILKKLHKNSKMFLWAKLGTFLAGIFFIYKSVFNDFDNYWMMAFGLFITLYLVALFLDSKLQRKIVLHEHLKKTLENEIAYLNRDFSPFDPGLDFIDPAHPYSFDLDVFGNESFFHRINRTVTDLGRKKLANYLTNLTTNIPKILKRQEALRELANLVKWRTHFIAVGSPTKVDLETLSAELQTNANPEIFETSKFKVSISISCLLTLGAIILAILGIAPTSLAILFFLLQILAVILFSGLIQKSTQQVGKLFKGLHSYRDIINHIIQTKFESEELTTLRNTLQVDEDVDIRKAFKELSGILNRLDQRANLLAFIFLNGLFLNDLWTMSSFAIWKKKYANYLPQWADTIGEFDALISLSTYVYNQPANCFVEFTEDKSVLRANGLYHPFIPKDKVVSNDFDLATHNFTIITGANMAGKSTFLRSVGINFIMALNGLTVCANTFEVTPMELFSSMRTSDNLVKNISYFNAELIRLEQMINYCKQNNHTLIILDEILKGTNSIDKLKGSKLLLEEISKLPVSGIIATHDLELTKMANENKHICNLCFEIELGDEINYTYKIEQGVAQNLNATYLLKKIISKINN